jgi:hypothetical protein
MSLAILESELVLMRGHHVVYVYIKDKHVIRGIFDATTYDLRAVFLLSLFSRYDMLQHN